MKKKDISRRGGGGGEGVPRYAALENFESRD